MFYTVYKTTNLINGKIYIGKHITEDPNDSYLGSGNNIRRAKKKYGEHNFKKEVLFIFDNEEDMNAKEAEIVTSEFIKDEMNYNLCPGGKGGFGYINENKSKEERIKTAKAGRKAADKILIEKYGENWRSELAYKLQTTEAKDKAKNTIKTKYPNGIFFGRNHSNETKLKMRKPKNVGSKNSQYGTCWITNGKEVLKILKEELDSYLSLGYSRGRKIKN